MIGDRKAAIAIEIANLFSNDDRDLNRDGDRDLNFGDPGNVLSIILLASVTAGKLLFFQA